MSCTRRRSGRTAAKVLEEDVHQLPEAVVGGLGELLANERVVV